MTKAKGKKVAPVKAKPKFQKPPVAQKPAVALKGAAAKKAAKSKDVDEEMVLPKTKFNAKELAIFRDLLLKLRDRIIDEISFLANDNLNRSQKDASGDLSSYSFHMADQGTDNFDREFAANLLSSEQDVLYEINEALRRVDAGSFGVCESSGKQIEKERLEVLPFARYCVAVQSEMERGKPRYRPFKRTSIQTSESA